MRWNILIAMMTGSILAGVPATSHAADAVRGVYGSGHSATAISYYGEECSLLRITEPNRSEIVRVCYPPVDMRPTRSAIPGSSGGTTVTSSSYSVQ